MKTVHIKTDSGIEYSVKERLLLHRIDTDNPQLKSAYGVILIRLPSRRKKRLLPIDHVMSRCLHRAT